MIRSFEVNLNAAHPELPLFEATAIVGSASTAFIKRVPASVGSWHISKVFVEATYPDGSVNTIEAKVGAEGVWTATLPACNTSGRVKSGFVIFANGVDELGEPVTGYLLGVADMAIYTRDLEIVPGPTGYVLKYFDVAPEVAKKGDVAPVDGVIKLYDGTQWVSLGGASDYSELDNKPSINDVELDGNKTGAALGLLSLIGGTLTGGIDFTNKSYPFCINKLPAAYEANLANTPKLAEIASKGFIGWFPGNGSYLVMSQYDLNGWPDIAWSDGEHEYSILIENRNTDGSVLLEYYNGTAWQSYHLPPYGGDIAMQYYIALAFSENRDYAQGAIVYKDGFIYKALVPHRGAWNASHFEQTTIGNAISAATSEAEGKADPSLIGIPAFSTELTYTVGAKVVYSNAVWNCTTAVETAGAWTGATNWTKLFDLATDAPASGGTSLITNGQVFAALTGLATKSDATLNDRYTDWVCEPSTVDGDNIFVAAAGSTGMWILMREDHTTGNQWAISDLQGNAQSTSLSFTVEPFGASSLEVVATRSLINGYVLGGQTSKPLASEAEAAALRTALAGKQATISASGLLKGDGAGGVSAAVPGTDYQAPLTFDNVPTENSNNPVKSGGVYTALRYALGETITATATLADRTNNRVVPAADNTTNIVLTFPAATAGKARDFLVLITNTTGNTGAISFKTPSGSSVYGDAFKTPIASGETWLYSFTEVANNEFFTRAQKMEDPYAPAYWGLYFEAEEAGAVVSMAKTGSPSAVTLETSTDGTTWTTFDAEGGTTPITLANEGDRVYFRAGTGGNTAFGSSDSNYHKFTLSKKCGAYGNIMSLLDGSNQSNTTISANYAFGYLFSQCANLTAAPLLPATTLTQDCYTWMFYGCTSLTSAPQLPATQVPLYGYASMFKGCTALTDSPDLLATTLNGGSYKEMFSSCSSLVNAPRIAATDFGWSNCAQMFQYCTSLSSMNVAFTQWGTGTASSDWLERVAANGTFTCPASLGTNETIERGADRCPSGWTVVNV